MKYNPSETDDLGEQVIKEYEEYITEYGDNYD